MRRLAAPAQIWLFGRGADLAVFGGAALASVSLVLLAPLLGVPPSGETPLWAWVAFVLCVDVAHVWSTLFRTYLDGEELRRRTGLYVGAPLVAYVAAVLAYAHSPALFWRLLAYAALFHFVRQQYGWMALYGRGAQTSLAERRLDAAAIYAATLGPVIWWHAHLPRPFWWLMEGDFAAGLPRWMGAAALAAHAAVLAAWVAFQARRVLRGRGVQLGKVLLVAATWTAWFGGIVVAKDDFSFTVMNVLLHGVPYLLLVHRYARTRNGEGAYGRLGVLLSAGVPGFLALVCALAFLEELLWDRLVWQERPLLFGLHGGALSEDVLALVIPLLALPQATHYLLDAFVWRPSRDPTLLRRLTAPPSLRAWSPELR